MKKILLAIIILINMPVFLLYSDYVCGKETDKKIDFVTIDIDKGKGLDKSLCLVITNEKEWIALWNKIYADIESIPEVPKIDFGSSTIIGVFDDRRRADGYSVKIKKVTEKDGEFTIHVNKSCSFFAHIFSNEITFPYHIVRIDVPNTKVKFEGI